MERSRDKSLLHEKHSLERTLRLFLVANGHQPPNEVKVCKSFTLLHKIVDILEKKIPVDTPIEISYNRTHVLGSLEDVNFKPLEVISNSTIEALADFCFRLIIREKYPLTYKSYIAIHTHRFGVSVYKFKCNLDVAGSIPSEVDSLDQIDEDFVKVLRELNIDFEPSREDEFMEIVEESEEKTITL